MFYIVTNKTRYNMIVLSVFHNIAYYHIFRKVSLEKSQRNLKRYFKVLTMSHLWTVHDLYYPYRIKITSAMKLLAYSLERNYGRGYFKFDAVITNPHFWIPPDQQKCALGMGDYPDLINPKDRSFEDPCRVEMHISFTIDEDIWKQKVWWDRLENQLKKNPENKSLPLFTTSCASTHEMAFYYKEEVEKIVDILRKFGNQISVQDFIAKVKSVDEAWFNCLVEKLPYRGEEKLYERCGKKNTIDVTMKIMVLDFKIRENKRKIKEFLLNDLRGWIMKRD